MPADAKHITPSLLDRLTDEDRDAPRDISKSYSKKLREFKESVLRDLAGLLTTRMVDPIDADYPRCAASLLGYGLVDFTTRIDSEELRREVQLAIERFEPRLRNVDVVTVVVQSEATRIHFSVRAILQVDPEPEPIYFDAVLDPSRSQLAVALGS